LTPLRRVTGIYEELRMMKSMTYLAAIALLGVGVAACDNRSSSTPGTGAGSGTSGSGTSPGTTGTGSTTGTGTTPGTTSPAAPPAPGGTAK